MNIDKNYALSSEDNFYGKSNKWQADCFGTWMHQDDYEDLKTKRNNRLNNTG